MWPRLSYHDTIRLTKRSSPLSRKKWPKRGSSLCQNNLTGHRVEENLIEQNDIIDTKESTSLSEYTFDILAIGTQSK